MTEVQEKQCRQYKRLDLALVSFRECKALAEHLIGLGIVPKSPQAGLYSACCAGIVVTYSRPFLAADGLGELPPQYAKDFDSQNMAETHRDLLKIRNTVFAHRDLVRTKNLKLHPDSDPGLFQSHIVFSPSRTGKSAALHSEPSLLYISEGSIPEIVSLCNFQIGRANLEAVKLLEHMAGSKIYRLGRYTVGEDFP